jgi:hypothetical protein
MPSTTGVVVQPKTGSQLSVVHTLPSSQSSGVPGVHTPAWQVSPPLHTLASLHEVPFNTGVLAQPVAASQLSVVQTLPSLQSSALAGVHTPFWQVSFPLQTSPSAHEEPLGSGAVWHPAIGSQLSVVQTLPSLHASGLPAAHTAAWQVSTPLQTLASAQEVPFTTGEYSQPKTGSQVSVVHGLASLQVSAVPAVQVPL